MLRILLAACLLATPALARPRARDLGIPFEGAPGPLNAITDVQGVEVGHSTLVQGEAVRTGVTVVFPRGKGSPDPVFAGWYALNGNGEMTGTTWIEEGGFLEGAVFLTNTHSVGLVRDASIEWWLRHFPDDAREANFSLPVVAETWDGFLNDIFGFHVKKEHVFQAMDGASSSVAEGNVGGGTGMISYGFKGGIGTSSRRLDTEAGCYTVGVLVQSNHGRRNRLTIAGVPVGKEIPDLLPEPGKHADGEGSIIVVVATDAPLLPMQLERLARRAALGIGRVGGAGENTSGDILLAFSTANPNVARAARSAGPARLTMLPNDRMDPLFWATVDATEEAIVNAMIAAETMKGAGGNTVHALPHDRLREILKKYQRLQP
ncbi:MAG: D-aminopeptidase [Acidobacteriota bacterium]|jgi:L-aminopeptidase/D-esterase-like protein|nr:D-aminopeptidase [Acidobacteriota bacterium]